MRAFKVNEFPVNWEYVSKNVTFFVQNKTYFNFHNCRNWIASMNWLVDMLFLIQRVTEYLKRYSASREQYRFREWNWNISLSECIFWLTYFLCHFQLAQNWNIFILKQWTEVIHIFLFPKITKQLCGCFFKAKQNLIQKNSQRMRTHQINKIGEHLLRLRFFPER